MAPASQWTQSSSPDWFHVCSLVYACAFLSFQHFFKSVCTGVWLPLKSLLFVRQLTVFLSKPYNSAPMCVYSRCTYRNDMRPRGSPFTRFSPLRRAVPWGIRGATPHRNPIAALLFLRTMARRVKCAVSRPFFLLFLFFFLPRGACRAAERHARSMT